MPRSYEFPQGFLHIRADRQVRMQPKWCLSLMVPMSRREAAEALRELRARRPQGVIA